MFRLHGPRITLRSSSLDRVKVNQHHLSTQVNRDFFNFGFPLGSIVVKRGGRMPAVVREIGFGEYYCIYLHNGKSFYTSEENLKLHSN